MLGYTGLTIEKLKFDEGDTSLFNVLIEEENNNFIEAGGFTGVIQLNLGFPL